jgi:hypothetical protein
MSVLVSPQVRTSVAIRLLDTTNLKATQHGTRPGSAGRNVAIAADARVLSHSTFRAAGHAPAVDLARHVLAGFGIGLGAGIIRPQVNAHSLPDGSRQRHRLCRHKAVVSQAEHRGHGEERACRRLDLGRDDWRPLAMHPLGDYDLTNRRI